MQSVSSKESHIKPSSIARPDRGSSRPEDASFFNENYVYNSGMELNTKTKRLSNASSVCSNASTVTSLSARPIYGLSNEEGYKRSIERARRTPGLDLVRTPSSHCHYSGYSKKNSSRDRAIDSTAHSCSQCHQISEKARRKIMDLEITNTSLLAVNTSLEHTIRQQAQQLVKLRKDIKRLQRGGEVEADEVESVLLGAETCSILSLESLDQSDTVSLLSTMDCRSSIVPSPSQLETVDEQQDEQQFGRVCNKIQGLIDMAAEAISVKSSSVNMADTSEEDVPNKSAMMTNTPLTPVKTPTAQDQGRTERRSKRRNVIDPKVLARLEAKLKAVDSKDLCSLNDPLEQNKGLFKSSFVEVPSSFLKRLMAFFESALFSQFLVKMSNQTSLPVNRTLKYLDEESFDKTDMKSECQSHPRVVLNYHEYSLIHRIQPHRRRVASVPTSLFALPKVQCPENERMQEDGTGSLYFSSVIS